MRYLILFLALCVIIAEVSSAERQRKHKKYRHEKKNKPATFYPKITNEELNEIKDELDILQADEIAEEKAKEEAEEQINEEPEVEIKDPCAGIRCGAGKECTINDEGTGHCTCMRFCQIESDPRRKVCSNHNDTWTSDCELYRMRCLCEENHEECTTNENKHVHVDYYGECKEIAPCTPDEMADFPRRMRDWLFNVMRDLADRKELSPHYLDLEKEAEEDLAHKWSNAAIWKWCDLDGHPHDRVVSRHELFPIRAPLLALEHCIGPFLNSCDENDDHSITLKEWGECLEIDQAELEDKCDEVH